MLKLLNSSSYRGLRIAAALDGCSSSGPDSAYKARSSCRSMTSVFGGIRSFVGVAHDRKSGENEVKRCILTTFPFCRLCCVVSRLRRVR